MAFARILIFLWFFMSGENVLISAGVGYLEYMEVNRMFSFAVGDLAFLRRFGRMPLWSVAAMISLPLRRVSVCGMDA